MPIAIVIAIATPILAFAGAMFGYWISARSARKDRRHQLSMAALEKRLAIHQEAYILCYNIYGDLWSCNRDPEHTIHKARVEAQLWLRDNCVYLDQHVRTNFTKFIDVSGEQSILIFHYYDRNNNDVKKYEDVANNLDILKKVLQEICDAVCLPSPTPEAK